MNSLTIIATLTALAVAYTLRTLYVDAREARRRNDRLAARLARAEDRARRAEEHADEAQHCLDLMLDVTRDDRKAAAMDRHPASKPVRRLIAVDGGRA